MPSDWFLSIDLCRALAQTDALREEGEAPRKDGPAMIDCVRSFVGIASVVCAPAVAAQTMDPGRLARLGQVSTGSNPTISRWWR
jgi:hypothetical protein